MGFGTRGMKLTNVTSAFQRELWCAWGSFRLSHLLSGPVADDWSKAQVWQMYGCVWSAGKGWWWLLGGVVQDRAGSARVCSDSSSAVKDFLLPPCQGLPCTREFSGLHTRSLKWPCWLETLCERIVQTSLVASSTCRERKCQPRERHELFGCYQTSSSMLLWVRSACISQWNKMIIVWLIEYTSFNFRCCHVTLLVLLALFFRRYYYLSLIFAGRMWSPRQEGVGCLGVECLMIEVSAWWWWLSTSLIPDQ